MDFECLTAKIDLQRIIVYYDDETTTLWNIHPLSIDCFKKG